MGALFALAGFFGFAATLLFVAMAFGDLLYSLFLRQLRELVGGVAAVALAACLFLLLRAGVVPTGDAARWAWTKDYYLQDIAALPHVDGRSRFKTWGWRDDGNTSQALVFDESDEILRLAGSQSPHWPGRRVHIFSNASDWPCIKSLRQHFYIAIVGCSVPRWQDDEPPH